MGEVDYQFQDLSSLSGEAVEINIPRADLKALSQKGERLKDRGLLQEIIGLALKLVLTDAVAISRTQLHSKFIAILSVLIGTHPEEHIPPVGRTELLERLYIVVGVEALVSKEGLPLITEVPRELHRQVEIAHRTIEVDRDVDGLPCIYRKKEEVLICTTDVQSSIATRLDDGGVLPIIVARSGVKGVIITALTTVEIYRETLRALLPLQALDQDALLSRSTSLPCGAGEGAEEGAPHINTEIFRASTLLISYTGVTGAIGRPCCFSALNPEVIEGALAAVITAGPVRIIIVGSDDQIKDLSTLPRFQTQVGDRELVEILSAALGAELDQLPTGDVYALAGRLSRINHKEQDWRRFKAHIVAYLCLQFIVEGTLKA